MNKLSRLRFPPVNYATREQRRSCKIRKGYSWLHLQRESQDLLLPAVTSIARFMKGTSQCVFWFWMATQGQLSQATFAMHNDAPGTTVTWKSWQPTTRIPSWMPVYFLKRKALWAMLFKHVARVLPLEGTSCYYLRWRLLIHIIN